LLAIYPPVVDLNDGCCQLMRQPKESDGVMEWLGDGVLEEWNRQQLAD